MPPNVQMKPTTCSHLLFCITRFFLLSLSSLFSFNSVIMKCLNVESVDRTAITVCIILKNILVHLQARHLSTPPKKKHLYSSKKYHQIIVYIISSTISAILTDTKLSIESTPLPNADCQLHIKINQILLKVSVMTISTNAIEIFSSFLPLCLMANGQRE